MSIMCLGHCDKVKDFFMIWNMVSDNQVECLACIFEDDLERLISKSFVYTRRELLKIGFFCLLRYVCY